LDRIQDSGFRIQGGKGLQKVAQDELVGKIVCGSQPETKGKSDRKRKY
jgi:hypothetical protein